MWLTQSAKNTILESSRSSEQVNNNEVSDKHEVKGCPLARYKQAICVASSGYIYMHGGRIDNMALDDDLWRYDIKNSSWSRLETHGMKPPILQEHTIVEHNEHLYLFGGQVSASNNERSFWQLDLKTNEWSLLGMEETGKLSNRLYLSNRRGHSALIYKDCMYVYGGYEDFRGSTGQLWEYQLLAKRWELCDLRATTTYKPKSRHNHSAIIYKDSMYIYGGLSNLKPLSDLWRWSWTEKRWFKERTKGRSPGHLYGHSAIQAFGSMFVFGGEQKGRKSCNLWRLNLSNLKWHKIRPKGTCPSASVWHRAVANPLNILDQFNYIVEGGDSSAQLNDDFECSQVSSHHQPLTNSNNYPKTSQDMSSNDSCSNLDNSRPSSYCTDNMRSKDSEIFDNLHTDIKKMFSRTFTAIPEQENYNLTEEESSFIDKNNMNEMEGIEKTMHKSHTLAPLRYSGTSYHSAGPVSNLTTSCSYETRNLDRPKSEIVQSLIERADNRIKHLYTPYFNTQQPEHKRYSLCDKPVGQKLAKTMTQYSLFFEDELNEQPVEKEDLRRNKFSTFRDICKEAMLVEEHKTPSIVESNSKISGLDVLSSAGSKTLCEPVISGQLGCSLDGTLSSPEMRANHFVEQEIKLNENIGDNNSFTLSILAEFEEDDILQYSSPTSKSSASARQKHPMNTESSCKLTIDSTLDSENANFTTERQDNQDKEEQHERIRLEYQEKNMDIPITSISSGYESQSNVGTESSANQLINHQRVESIGNDDLDLEQYNLGSNNFSQRLATFSSQTVTSFQTRKSIQRSSSFARRRLAKLFGSVNRGEKKTTRYRQLCMLVFGGKQDSNISLCNGPVTVWRLYI